MEVQVSRRKGRLLAATIGGLLLGPLGFAAGLGVGTRTETRTEERKSYVERTQEIRSRRQALDIQRQERRQALIAQGKDPDLGKKVFWAVIVALFGLPVLFSLVFQLGRVLGHAFGL